MSAVLDVLAAKLPMGADLDVASTSSEHQQGLSNKTCRINEETHQHSSSTYPVEACFGRETWLAQKYDGAQCNEFFNEVFFYAYMNYIILHVMTIMTELLCWRVH